MKLGVVTPTRGGEREAFVAQARQLCAKQTYKPANHYIIDYRPKGQYVDMVERILLGVELAHRDKCTHLAIWEDDDYYRYDYLANMAEQLTDDTAMMGSSYTPTYHLGSRRWGLEQAHTTSVSLHRSVGSVKFLHWALTHITDEKAKGMWYMDHHLWATAVAVKAKAQVVNTELFDCVAMKHGIGMCGSGYHNRKRTDVYPYTDADMHWLKKFTGDDYAFYASQSQVLNKDSTEVI